MRVLARKLRFACTGRVARGADKSSADWDVYKRAEGLGDELAHAQAEGHENRAQFLARAAHREHAAAKAAKASGGRR